MTDQTLCSIVITCYNKGHVIAQAIRSALAQTDGNLEVIVVDDGSTDASESAINTFIGRVTIVRQRNGGQASAINTGYRACRGAIILFLDGDDLLDEDAVARIRAVWTEDTAKVHFRLRVVDADGRFLGSYLPPYKPLLSDELNVKAFCRFGFYPSPPRSGNAFSRWYLDAVLPVPEADFRTHGELILLGLAPLFGVVKALEGPAGSWRKDAFNESTTGGLDKAEALLQYNNLLMDVARRQDLTASRRKPRLQAALLAHWPVHLKNLLILTKFRPTSPLAGHSVGKTARLYLGTIASWPEYSVKQRAAFAIWAVVMLVCPRSWLYRIPGIIHPLRLD
jgi:glycosyltransferase involved in cell wall biosynthesis